MALTGWFTVENSTPLKEGDRIDIQWANGNTSAHDYVMNPATHGYGFWLIHNETKIWMTLAQVRGFRKIPGGNLKRPRDPRPRPRNPHRGSL